MGKIPRVLPALLIANVALFLATQISPDVHDTMERTLALSFPGNERFQPWQFLTSVFMHANISHLFFNMFALLSFGLPLVQIWGARRFLTFYLVAGVGAAIIYTGVQWFEYQTLFRKLVSDGVPTVSIEAMLRSGTLGIALRTPAMQETFLELYRIYITTMLGASGAVYGVLVAFAFNFPNARLSLMFLPVPIAAKYFIPIIVGLDLLSGVTGFSIFGGGVAHFAHVGGALIGFLFMLIWRHTPVRDPFGHAG